MNDRFRMSTLLFCGLFVASGSAAPLHAQMRRAKVYDLRKNRTIGKPYVVEIGPKGAKPVPPGVNQPAGPASGSRLPEFVPSKKAAPTAAGSAPNRPQKPAFDKIRRLDRQAAEIERLCGRSFNRSLMELEDYADYLDVALQLRLAAAEHAPAPQRARIEAYHLRAKQLRRAAQQTTRFPRPGAAGWASESAMANLLASRASADWAKTSGDQKSFLSWVDQGKQFADKLLQFRGWEYRLGLANDRQLIDAAQLKSGSVARSNSGSPGVQPPDVAAMQQTLNSHVERITSMQRRRAGNTRPDELHAAKARLLEYTARTELAAGRKRSAVASWLQADREKAAEFEQLQKFARKGTASLGDLVRCWRQRDRLQRSMREAGQKVPRENWNGRRDDLQKLQKFANSIRDRRGRRAADFAVVEALGALEARRPATPGTPEAPPSGSVPAETAAANASQPLPPRIFDIKQELQKRRLRGDASPNAPRRSDGSRTVIYDFPPRRTPPEPPATAGP